MTASALAIAATAGLAAVVSAGLTRLALQRTLRRLRNGLLSCRAALVRTRALVAWHRALYRIVAEDAGDAIIRLDAAGRPVHLSLSAKAVLGHRPPRQPAGNIFGLICEEDQPVLRAALSACGLDASAHHVQCRIQRPDGRIARIDLHCRHVPADGGVVVLMRDISDQHLMAEHLSEARNRLEALALHDPLTGLFNRSGFLAAADRLLSTPRSLAVLLINLDRFKTFNDLHGHAHGDGVLREIGLRLARVLGPEATVARLNGDEFAAVLPAGEGDMDIAARAREVIRTVGDPVRTADMALDTGATIGISVSPRDGSDTSAMLRAADIALAYGKTAGGGCYRFFEPRMNEALAREAELKSELRAAVANGRIVPYFQPVVTIHDAALVGFEVLARWDHPTRGVVPPSVFLPLVEELGLGTEMFRLLLTSICATARDWPADIRLAVKVSSHDLQDETLPDAVRDILEPAGFDGARLEIEITDDALTDDALTHDANGARGVIERLRALGITITLDSFGSGCSSLHHLRALPLDKVKIDPSLIHALDTDADGARYVAAVMGLCRALGLATIAEGVESEAALRHLRELGCTYGQGNLFGRPMPAAEAGRLLDAQGQVAGQMTLGR